MVSLATVGRRHEIAFTVIEGGSGVVNGILSETDQNAQPSYIFVKPRHVLRAALPTAIKPGLVLRSPSGLPFIVGENGPSEQAEGTLWNSYRLFEPTGYYRWERRTKVMDPITRQAAEGPRQYMGMVWAALEPLDREMTDREMRHSFEQRRVISGAQLKADDILDNQTITKLDRQLGLAIGVLT